MSNLLHEPQPGLFALVFRWEDAGKIYTHVWGYYESKLDAQYDGERYVQDFNFHTCLVVGVNKDMMSSKKAKEFTLESKKWVDVKLEERIKMESA
jgi:hypothetical protein